MTEPASAGLDQDAPRPGRAVPTLQKTYELSV